MTQMLNQLILARTTGGCTAVFVNQVVVAEANSTADIDRLVVKTAHQLSNSLGVPLLECSVEVPAKLDGKWAWADLYPMLQPVPTEPLNADSRWAKICDEQNWNSESQVLHLEGFIRDKGLFPEFTAYAMSAAKEENQDVSDTLPG